MTKDDLVYVGHMLDAAQEIHAILRVKTRSDFASDRVLRLAVTHLIQNIGEAASRVSPAFQGAHSNVPWSVIVGMRNRIVQSYVDVNDSVVWETALRDVPRLVEMLSPFVPEA